MAQLVLKEHGQIRAQIVRIPNALLVRLHAKLVGHQELLASPVFLPFSMRKKNAMPVNIPVKHVVVKMFA